MDLGKVSEQFWNKVIKTDNCWNWVGMVNQAGYGIMTVPCKSGMKKRRAHRIVLILLGKEVPDGKVVDHACRNRACVNPGHLRIVTNRENSIENSTSPAALNARKTACLRGHTYTQSSMYLRKSKKGHPKRECRICAREMSRIRRSTPHMDSPWD